MSNIPEKIYRYQKFNTLSLDGLCSDRLYFSAPSAFNDPLDSKPAVEQDTDKQTLRLITESLIKSRVKQEILSSLKSINLEGKEVYLHAENQAQKSAYNKIKNIAHHATNPNFDCEVEEALCKLLTYEIQSEIIRQNNMGICCFSSEYDNPLLWSHYGDQHHGICVGYSLNRKPKPTIHKVLYGGVRTVKTSLIAQAILNNDKNAQRQLEESIFLRKALPWEYEKEWRIIGESGLQDSPLLLEEVIFGLRCPDTVIHSVIAALRPRNIDFYTMHEAGDSFELKRTDNIGEICAPYPRTAYSGVEAFGSPDD